MSHGDCGCDRREFLLKSGLSLATGMFGLNMVTKFFLEEAYGLEPNPALQKYDSIIQIFYDGGPSQTDTWDPKPGSNSNVFPTVLTGANDIYGNPFRLSDVFTSLAGLVNDPAFGVGAVRSMTHGNADHSSAQQWMNCFWQSPVADLYPSTAASMAHLNEDRMAGVGIPSVRISGSNGADSNSAKGGLCPTAFNVFNRGAAVEMLARPTGVDQVRYAKRQRITQAFDDTFLGSRPDNVAQAWNTSWRRAMDVTNQGLARGAFDTAGVTRLPGGTSSTEAVSTGVLDNLTLAQNLVMNGVPYVALGIGGNDTHTGNMARIRRNWGDMTDVPLAQMAQNLKATGKRVLIVMGGEFGRRPDNVAAGTRDGRDHWARGFSWGLFSINQPAFKTTAVGNTGPDGMWTDRSTTKMKHPTQPSAFGGMLYRAMGYDVGNDPNVVVPTPIGNRPPIDINIANGTPANDTDFVGSGWLMQQFGLI